MAHITLNKTIMFRIIYSEDTKQAGYSNVYVHSTHEAEDCKSHFKVYTGHGLSK